MEKITQVKGMQDIFVPEIKIWHHIESIIRSEAELFGYNEIRTPILEKTELFTRSIGNATDIVKKEMYTFYDKGERQVTMRPEGTAPVVRAVLEHNMLNNGDPILKFYYIGPMFRYERPQKGRLRQFHQFGVECFGSNSPYIDAEVIQLLYNVLTKLKLNEINVKINSLGCKKCRDNIKQNIVKFFNDIKNNLCTECNDRININPLRVYDCKIESCKNIIANAPTILDYLCNECIEHFEKVKNALKIINIPFEVEPKLVRGLDYYTKTAFEITSKYLGACDALGGGGRYDNLVSELGGPSIPAIGFGMGIERVVIAMLNQQINIDVKSKLKAYIIPLSENEFDFAFNLQNKLRENNISSQMALTIKKIGSQFKDAEKLNSEFAIIIGEDEIKNNIVTIKNLSLRTQQQINVDNVVNYFKNNL